MKNRFFIAIACLAFASCGNPKIPKSLPVEKVYIMEFDFIHLGWDGDTDESILDMELLGLVELKNNFDLKITKRAADGEFFETELSIPDSLRIGINKIIGGNQTDTAYIHRYPEGENLNKNYDYSEHYYQIIIERKFYESTKIFFNKNLLPDDLKTLFDQLYENPMKKKSGEDYQNFIDRVQLESIRTFKKSVYSQHPGCSVFEF